MKLDALNLNDNIIDLQKEVLDIQNTLKKMQAKGIPICTSKGADLDLLEKVLILSFFTLSIH